MGKKTADEKLKESLSAALDGEANDIELQKVLMNFRKTDLGETAKRYRMVDEILRKSSNSFAGMDISERVAKQIRNESITPQKQKKGVVYLFNNLSKMAVAASVTIAVILGVRNWNNDFDATTSVEQHTISESSHLASHFVPDDSRNYGGRGVLAGNSETDSQNQAANEKSDEAKKRAYWQNHDRIQLYSLIHAKSAMSAYHIQSLVSLLRAIN